MATVAMLGTPVWNTTAGAKSVVATPTVGDLIVAVGGKGGLIEGSGRTFSDNNSGGAGTYSLVSSATTTAAFGTSLNVYIRTSLIAAATSTTFSEALNGASDGGGGVALFRISGMTQTGLSAVVQTKNINNQAASTPSLTMDAAISTANAVIGGIINQTNGTANTAPPTGWTEGWDLGFNTPTTGWEGAFRSSGETRTTIPWTAASPSAWGAWIIELDASGGGGGATDYVMPYIGGGYYP